MEVRREEIRKGPWKAEEDEVLINHVKKYGPREWSSIRSKGLLQRTGKSCRLRWVNKLRPNLKNGCKFSAEEERLVIELQGQFGNKWAKIATYLPGRTDNDVKNFWSSRQKRLARVLKTPKPSSEIIENQVQVNQSNPTFDLKCDPSVFNSSMEEELSKPHSCSSSSYIDNPGMVPFLDLVHEEPYLQIPLPQLVQPQQELTFSPADQELLARIDDPFLLDDFGAVDPAGPGDGSQLSLGQSMFDPAGSLTKDVKNQMSSDTFFDDFPADIFDHIDSLPGPSGW
ncbi:hypothetical protein K2173_024893 [Erythroxylum novogranatense]|uniref:Uncharacterized protein n=1 Tax=Erythroxylum novogranatense TaxID=1862640 RepID=A0AAV8UFD3_9ROSI|nr:hypothetical protein K2173_024893 [Erythroxylum novogranatense]